MPTSRRDAVEVTLCGRRTRLAQNMYELARAHRATIMIFHSDTDLATGERRIRFRRLPDDMTPIECTRAFAEMLDSAIAADPSGWRFWSIAPSFFPELAHEAA
jgi:lauroyl/myristoyl acyltransferase